MPIVQLTKHLSVNKNATRQFWKCCDQCLIFLTALF